MGDFCAAGFGMALIFCLSVLCLAQLTDAVPMALAPQDLQQQLIKSYNALLAANSSQISFVAANNQGTAYPAPEAWGEMTRVGTEYGGYPIFMKRMNADAKIFSFGLGADVSFDVALMKASGATVHGFDNTPKHMEWWNAQGKASIPGGLKFEHHELLLGVEDGTLKLSLPAGHATSYAPGTSSKQGFQDGSEVELPAKSLASLVKEHNVQQLEVLKIDVEGAEWALLESWVQQWGETGLPACQLMIEFHQRLVDGDGAVVRAKAVENLEKLGFQLAHHVDKEDGADDNLFINTKVCK